MKKQIRSVPSDLLYLVGKVIKLTIEDIFVSRGLKKLNLGPPERP